MPLKNNWKVRSNKNDCFLITQFFFGKIDHTFARKVKKESDGKIVN